MVTKIISGAQTGADQGGLEAGKILGLETGGTAPLGYRTDSGANPTLKKLYNIGEDESYNYKPRTIKNVGNSSGTAWFGNESSPGGKLTISTCKKFGKPYCINPSKLELIKWIEWNNIKILNVAGNRESSKPGLQQKVRDFLVMVLSSEEYNHKEEIK